MIATNTALDRKANPRVFIVMPTYNRWGEAREFGKWTRPDLTAPEVRVEHPPGGRGVLIPTRCFREIGLVDMKTFSMRCTSITVS